jgi:threonine/homoserine/homoserine lactone efflux protein
LRYAAGPVVPFFIGFLFGCVGSIPPTGPTSVLVLERALKGRTARALAVALGGALPEAGYAALALWGFGRLVLWHPWLYWTGPALAAIVVVLSIRDLLRGEFRRDARAKRAQHRRQWIERRRGIVRCFGLGFATASLNTTMLFTWGAVAALVHRTSWIEQHTDPLWLMPVGIFFGIVAWLALAIAVADRLGARYLEQEPGR